MKRRFKDWLWEVYEDALLLACCAALVPGLLWNWLWRHQNRNVKRTTRCPKCYYEIYNGVATGEPPMAGLVVLDDKNQELCFWHRE